MKQIFFTCATILLLSIGCKIFETKTIQSLKAVSITDPGEIIAPYNLREDTAAAAAVNSLPAYTAKQKEEVFTYCREIHWPTGMASLPNRQRNREYIKKYQAYLLTSFNHATKGTLNILLIPKEQNNSVTAPMALEHDIYIVITSKGIELK